MGSHRKHILDVLEQRSSFFLLQLQQKEGTFDKIKVDFHYSKVVMTSDYV